MARRPEASDYRFIRKLGEGSFGSAWLCKHLPTARLVCLKAIDDTGAGRDQSHQEVATLSQLSHPNCIRSFGSFREADTLFISMQYADGGDLAGRIKEAAQAQTPFPERQVLGWFAQLCLGLQHMHALRILHRDLKPQNILLRRHPLGDRVLIGDLGISRPLTGTLDQARTAIGTPSYIAPEIFASQPYAFAADVWSLGCILYELANLHQAFKARSLNDLSQKVCTGLTAALRPGVSTHVQDLISHVLQVNPTRRPSVLALLQSASVAPYVQAYATELAEEDMRGGDEDEGDAAGRAALRQQLEKCGMKPASQSRHTTNNSSSSSGSGSGSDVEREQRLQAVLARLRREREARIAAPLPPEGTAEQPTTPLGLSKKPSQCRISSPTTTSPPASPPTPSPPPQQATPPPPSTVAERIQESRAFLRQVLGAEGLGRAYGLVRGQRECKENGQEEKEDLQGRLAAVVFAGPKAKYHGLFTVLLEMEEAGRG